MLNTGEVIFLLDVDNTLLDNDRLSDIERSDRAGGFVVQAKRWIVERTLAWISRNRRLARDFENLAATAKALNYLAMIKLMLRRLARP